MEKREKLFALFMFFLVLIPLISSVEFSVKGSYDQEETLIAKISGNFVDPVLKEDIAFYKYYDGAEVGTAVEFDLLRIEGDYYVYAQLEKSEGNYSVKIEDIRYYQGGDITDEPIVREFTISNSTADFYAEPGVVKTTKDFSIEVQNLQTGEITISVDPENKSTEFFSFFGSPETTETERQYTLYSGEIKNIDFELENKTGLKTITMSSDSTTYEIPVYSIVSETTQENDSKNESSGDEIYFSYDELNLTILTGNKIQKIFTITNSLQKEVENISLEVSDNLQDKVNLTQTFIPTLEPKQSKEAGMKILSKEIGIVEGNITMEIENMNYTQIMDLNFIFENETKTINQTQNQTQNKTTNETVNNSSQNQTKPSYKTCSQEGGQICNSTAVCEGQQIEASDGECCLGMCKIEEEDNTGKVVGWTIVIVVVLFLVWFYLVRYKGIKSKINILDEAKGKKKQK